jgi:single-stranded DNA-binding protein
MAPLHRVYFLGTVIQDPAMWAASNGTAVARWSLAVPTRQRQGDAGHADVCRIEVLACGRQAAVAEAALRQGCTVLIEGRVQWWRTAQGSRSRPPQAVIAERIQCLSCPRQTPCAAAGGGGARRGVRLVGDPCVAAALPGEGRGVGRDGWGRQSQGGAAQDAAAQDAPGRGGERDDAW